MREASGAGALGKGRGVQRASFELRRPASASCVKASPGILSLAKSISGWLRFIPAEWTEEGQEVGMRLQRRGVDASVGDTCMLKTRPRLEARVTGDDSRVHGWRHQACRSRDARPREARQVRDTGERQVHAADLVGLVGVKLLVLDVRDGVGRGVPLLPDPSRRPGQARPPAPSASHPAPHTRMRGAVGRLVRGTSGQEVAPNKNKSPLLPRAAQLGPLS